jgi:hypothetical protein
MGRPPLTPEQVRRKVVDYCQRHGVSPVPDGLPPFPSGRRETRQHREWLSVYRAQQRLEARSSATAAAARSGSEALCPICAIPIAPEDSVALRGAGRRAPFSNAHAACADLFRLADEAGADAIARLTELLWPRRGRARSS